MAKKILIIEDDKILSEMYQQKMAKAGYDVVGAENASSGLTLLKTFSADLILLDIMLPGGMNGFDFLQILKKDKNFAKIPVIVLTNLDLEKKTALELGAKDFFVKSETPLDDLVKLVKKHTPHGLFG